MGSAPRVPSLNSTSNENSGTCRNSRTVSTNAHCRCFWVDRRGPAILARRLNCVNGRMDVGGVTADGGSRTLIAKTHAW